MSNFIASKEIPIILVANESQQMRRQLTAALASQHYAIVAAEDCRTTLDLAKKAGPALILLDIGPKGCGIESLFHLKGRPETSDIPVIVITCEDEDRIIEKAIEVGAVDYIAKPFSEKIVLTRVRNALRTREAINAIAAKRQLQDAVAQAESASRIKSEFLANISHEIRTPMTAILGFADLLLNSVEGEQNVDAVQTIRRNGQFLLSLVNDILDLSKIEAGRVEIEKIECRLPDLLSDVESLMRVKAEESQLNFSLKHVNQTPSLIFTDPTRLRQILLNLVSNAIKFTEEGDVHVEIELFEEAEQVEIRVTDTGIGMTEDQLSRLFRPFTQADATVTRRFGGTGLGLFISKRFAELLGGDINVTSTHGEGSTFVVRVATGPLDMVRDQRAHSSTTSQSSSPDSVEGKRVLLAEDGPDNQRLITFVLEKAGAHVEVAENGQVAVDRVLNSDVADPGFDIVLMDMQMPVMDGYTAVKELRQRGYDGPIIALTAHAMTSDRKKCLDAGCTEYTTKPIKVPELLSLVGQYAAQSREAVVESVS